MKSSDDAEELEASIDALGYWMVVSTGVVALGLFIELASPLRKLWDDHDLKDFVGSSIGSLLVAGGVSAELLIEFFARRKERKLRLINAEKERQSNEKLKLADVRIAEAEKRAEEARLETEKLKAQFAWRQLTHEQQTRLISELSTKPGSILIERIDGDIEAQFFSNQFVYVFTQAKWNVGWRCWRGGNLIVTGLALSLPSATPPKSINEVAALLDVFKLAGIEIGIGGDLSWGWSQSTHSALPPEPAFRLFVGVKQPHV